MDQDFRVTFSAGEVMNLLSALQVQEQFLHERLKVGTCEEKDSYNLSMTTSAINKILKVANENDIQIPEQILKGLN